MSKKTLKFESSWCS